MGPSRPGASSDGPGAKITMTAREWWAVIKLSLEGVRKAGGTGRYQAICPLHRDTQPSMSIDLNKGDGVWYCHGECKRGGALETLAIEMGWVETEAGPVRMDWLPPPYEYLHVEPDTTVALRIIRWQEGLSKRPIEDPPGFRSLLTIRFHVPHEDKADGPPYYDFTNLTLIIRFQDIRMELLDRSRLQLRGLRPLLLLSVVLPRFARMVQQKDDRIARLLAVFDPSSTATLPVEEAITLRLTRRGRGRDTRYDVKLLKS